MLLYSNEAFANDLIGILIGFDGLENREMLKWSAIHSGTHPCRLAFAINQHYPEFQGEHYFNKRLVALIQEALSEIQIYAVIDDILRSTGSVPVEIPGSLEFSVDYILVHTTMEVRGKIHLWESLGGKSPFYHDRCVLKLVLKEENVQPVVQAVIDKCMARGVAYDLTIGRFSG